MTISPTELAQIPPSVLDTLPALQPPAGTEPNFVDPEDRGYIANAVATVLFCLMVFFFANRVYTKISIIRKAGWDDLTCTIGFLCSIAIYVLSLWSTKSGPVGRHQWNVRLVDYTSERFLKISSITVYTGPVALLFTKVTFFIFYFQSFRPLRWLRMSVYIGTTFTCAFYGVISVVQIALSAPRRGETWLESFLVGRAVKFGVFYIPLAAVGFGIDIVIFVMPIVAVMGLQLSSKDRIGIICILMVGMFACVGSLLGICYSVILYDSPDITWNVLLADLVREVELFIGISCACIPAFSKMLHHHLPALKKFRSVLSACFIRIRSSKPGDKSHRSEFSQSDPSSQHPVANRDLGPYSHLDVQSPKSHDTTLQPAYELGQFQSVQTFIRRGREKGASDDKIHLTHEIQQQARMH